ncbi:hypothetical protein [Bremerella cremea]|uniref:hypothetical protein n=1 Tax=Bremerella cremea TaxID=1031537 RepID=UPI0031EDCF5C
MAKLKRVRNHPVSLGDVKAAAKESRRPLKDNPWGLDLFVRKIPGKIGVTLIAKMDAAPKDEKGDPDVVPETMGVVVEVLSKGIVNASGDPIFDNSEGLALLDELTAQEQMALYNQMPLFKSSPQVPEKNDPLPTAEVPSE